MAANQSFHAGGSQPTSPALDVSPASQFGMGGGQGMGGIQGMNASQGMGGMPMNAQPSSGQSNMNAGFHNMNLHPAQLAQLSPAEREKHLMQIRMLQMQRMRERQHAQGQGGQSQEGLPGQSMQNMGGMGGMGGMQAMQGMQGMQGMGGMQGMQGMQGGMQGANPAHERFQQLAQGQYDPHQRPSSAASSSSHRASSVQPPGMPNMGHPQPNQSQMMPPPTGIPPRPPTATAHRQQGSQQYGNLGAPSPRPHTAGGPAATPSPRTHAGPLPPGTPVSGSAAPTPGGGGPIPIQPRPTSTAPGAGPTRPGTSTGMRPPPMPQVNQGPIHNQGQTLEGMQVPSRPTTASGFNQQQPGQNAGMLNLGAGQQAAKSPSGYPPIAPAPTAPGSPVRGARRKSGTPVPGGQPGMQQQPQQVMSGIPQAQSQQAHQQDAMLAGVPPQTPRMSMSVPNLSNTGMGANGVPNVAGIAGMGVAGNVGPSSAVANQMMNMGMGLVGGAGGGMMGPPVLPRGPSHAGDMAMGMGVNGRQMSSGGMTANVMSGMGASPVQGMNAGVGMDLSAPHTPVRQNSQPPASMTSPFANTPSNTANAGVPSAPALDRKPSVQDAAALPAPDGAHSRTSSVANGLPSSTPATNGAAVAAPPTIIPQLTPLNVQLNPKTSRVTIVPLVGSGTRIPQLSPTEIANVKLWMEIDKEYDGRYKAMKEKMGAELRETIVKPKAWWEKDAVMEDGRVPFLPQRGLGAKRPEKWSLTGVKQSKEKEIRDKKRAGKREGFKPYVPCFVSRSNED